MSAATRRPNDLVKRVAAIREEIGELKAEAAGIASAPLPRVEILETIDASLDEIRQRWKSPVSGLLHGRRVTEFLAVPGTYGSYQGAIEGLIATVAGDALREKLVDLVDAALEETGVGMPAADRPAALEAIAKQLFALEIEEETAIRKAVETGLRITRRADADPSAVLGLQRRRAS